MHVHIGVKKTKVLTYIKMNMWAHKTQRNPHKTFKLHSNKAPFEDLDSKSRQLIHQGSL